MYVYMCVYVCMYVCMYVCTYVHIFICMYAGPNPEALWAVCCFLLVPMPWLAMMGVFGILGLWKITFVTSSLCHSRSSVKSPVKVFESRENFCFTFLYGPMTFRKILVQTAKWSISPKITDLQNSGKSSWRPFSYVGSIFKCLQLIYSWKGNFIRINKN